MYSLELVASICERIANGQSLREICRDDDMPSKTAVMNWLNSKPEFVDQYARAMEARADYWADEILEIADDSRNDWLERQRETKGVHYVENAEAINRSRLRVDARKWLMSKMAPKKYGDKIDHDVKGNLSVVIESKDADL